MLQRLQANKYALIVRLKLYRRTKIECEKFEHPPLLGANLPYIEAN